MTALAINGTEQHVKPHSAESLKPQACTLLLSRRTVARC